MKYNLIMNSINSKFSIVLLLTIFLISCNNEKEQHSTIGSAISENKYITLYLDEIEGINNLKLSSVFLSARPIILELTDNSIIGSINKMQVIEDKLIILDKSRAKSLFVFNKDGKFLYKVGERGGGPGEYTGISDFTIDIDRKIIFLMDENRQIINAYDLMDGKFLYDINIRDEYSKSYHIQFADSVLYTDLFYKDRRAKEQRLLRSIDIKTGNTQNLFLDVKYNKGFNEMYFTGKGVFFSRNNNPVYMQLFMDTLMTLSNNKVLPYIVLNSKNLVNSKDIENTRKISGSYITGKFFRTNKYHSLENFIESDKFFIIKCGYANSIQYLYYDKTDGNLTINNVLADDVLFKSFDPRKNKVWVDFLCEGSEGIYAQISNLYLAHFIDAIQKDELKDNVYSVTDLSRIDENSNPIIILYEYK